jgi:DNA-binding protein HU-beta
MKRHVPTGKLNHMALVEAVAAEAGVSVTTAAKVLRATFDVIPRNVAAGYEVNVSNFGTWFTGWENARTVRNPQTGETWPQAGRPRPRFRWAPAVKDAVRYDGTELPETFKKRASHR